MRLLFQVYTITDNTHAMNNIPTGIYKCLQRIHTYVCYTCIKLVLYDTYLTWRFHNWWCCHWYCCIYACIKNNQYMYVCNKYLTFCSIMIACMHVCSMYVRTYVHTYMYESMYLHIRTYKVSYIRIS